MFVAVGSRRRRRKESRLERARREGRVEERAREREAVAREESGRQRVRPGFGYQTIREIALASLYRSVRVQAAGRALSWRSVRLSEASKKKGGYSMCVRTSCVCVSTHDPRDRRRYYLLKILRCTYARYQGVVLPDGRIRGRADR